MKRCCRVPRIPLLHFPSMNQQMVTHHPSLCKLLLKRLALILIYYTGKEAEYAILEDDRYYVGIINANRKSVIMTLNVNVTSKIYDISKAKRMCSTIKGSCHLNLFFPTTQYVILTTPNNVSPFLLHFFFQLNPCLSCSIHFNGRLFTGRSRGMACGAFFCGSCGNLRFNFRYCFQLKSYFILYISVARLKDPSVGFAGLVVILIFLLMKYLRACEGENEVHHVEEIRPLEVTETDPLMPEKPFRLTYGTGEDEAETGICGSSSEDLYDGKICIICYDGPRNCFFVPCGHCATCYDCARR